MGKNEQMAANQSKLESGLQRLGIRELEERLEVSPLIFAEPSNCHDPFEPGSCFCDPRYPKVPEEQFPLESLPWSNGLDH